VLACRHDNRRATPKMADEKQLLSLRSLSFLPTKKEQYTTLRKLQMLSIADKHTYCQRALKTTPAVNRTTNSFYQDLNSLTSGSLTSKPVLLDPMQLHVLKHCSKTFSQIIQNCPNHRIPLTQIKVS
jgi:fumarylacetoacetate (FAA) hydrolase family protein